MHYKAETSHHHLYDDVITQVLRVTPTSRVTVKAKLELKLHSLIQ